MIKGALKSIGYISLKAWFLKELIIIAAQISPKKPLNNLICILLLIKTFQPLINCKENAIGMKLNRQIKF